MIGGDGLDLTPAQRLPQVVLLFFGPQGRSTDIPGGGGVVGVKVYVFIQQQVLRAGLHIDLLAPAAGVLHLLEGLLIGQVDDHHRAVRRLGNA